MAAVTSSIGTTSRDYSTIQAWENDIGVGLNTVDDHTGECYDDTTFDEAYVLNVNAGAVILSVASAERGDGTEGTGARIVATADRGCQMSVPGGKVDARDTYYIEFLEHDGSTNNISIDFSGSSFQDVGALQSLLIHDASAASGDIFAVSASGRDTFITNVVVYNWTRASANMFGIRSDSDRAQGGVLNCIVTGLTNASGNTTGIEIQSNDTDGKIYNNISSNNTASGTASDFTFLGTSVDADYNLSEDATADDGHASPPGNNLVSQTHADLFVSSTNYNVQDASAPSVDAGSDQSAEGHRITQTADPDVTHSGTWEIGAYNFSAAAGLSVNVSDSVTVNENTRVGLNLGISEQEAVTVADVDTVVLEPLAVSEAESVTVTDVETVQVSGAAPLTLSVVETITATDVDTVTETTVRITVSESESVTVTDVDTVQTTGVGALTISAVDTVTATDVDSVVLDPLVVSQAESVTVTDVETAQVTGVGALTISAVDTVTATDVDIVVLEPLVALAFESVTVTDVDSVETVAPASLTISASEAVTVTDIDTAALATVRITASVSESVTVAENTRISVPRIVSTSETVAANDTAVVVLTPLVISEFEGITVTDVDTIQVLTSAELHQARGRLTVASLDGSHTVTSLDGRHTVE